MRLTRKILVVLFRAIALGVWLGLGVWTALAVFFALPAPLFVAAPLALAIGILFSFAAREPFRLCHWFTTPWQRKRLTSAALLVSAMVMTGYFGFMSPDPHQDWAPEHSHPPVITIQGDKIHVANVRNFTWQSDHETERYDERDYDMGEINSMYFALCPFARFDGVAHVFVSFGFSDGQHVCVSVEGRRLKGRPFRMIPSLFRQYQLIYVVGDERDVVGLRGAIWKVPVYYYPVRTSPGKIRAIFLALMQRAHSLEVHPEFYNLITNNCFSNITDELRRLGGGMPANLQLVMTGYSDRIAYQLGFIDTDLPFEKARQAFRIDQWMQSTQLDEGFSRRLRENLINQVAAHGGRTDGIQ